MIRVGVTGGIGSGKSTVCALFAALGVPVYDSDCRARELMNGGEDVRLSSDGSGRGEGGGLRRDIVDLLGEEAYRDGMLDRAFVARKVFGNKTLLASLNAIVHPVVAVDFEAWMLEQEAQAVKPGTRAAAQTAPPYVILESAILFESGFNKLVDKTIAVCAPFEIRLARSGFDRDDFARRAANQISDDERAARADYTIDNNATLNELAARVEELDKLLKP